MARFSITDRGLEKLEDLSGDLEPLEEQALIFFTVEDDLSPEQLAELFIGLTMEPSRARIQSERIIVELVRRGLVAPMGTASLRARIGRRMDRVSPSLSGPVVLTSEFGAPRTFREGPVTRRDLLEQESF